MATTPVMTNFGFMSRADKNTLDNIKNTYLAADVAANTYAPLSSPTFVGTPTAPTPSQEDSSTRIATTAYVTEKISTIDLSKIDLSGKVDVVEGKGLSTEDYTTEEKNKLAGIASNAQVNVVETIKVNNTALTPTNKTVNIDLSGKVDKVTGKGLSTNDYTTTEKNKLAGIAEGANNYSLPVADSNTLGGVKIGSGITISNSTISVANATTLAGGLMSSTDKAKLDGIATGAQVNVIDTIKVDGAALSVTDKTINIDLSGKVDKIIGKDLSTEDYTTAEKNKLSGISDGAQVNTIETVKVNGTALTPSSKAVNIDLSGYVATETGKGLSTNDFTTTQKNKLSGIATGAQVNVIETVKVNNTALTPSNKAVNIDLSGYVATETGKALSTNDYTTDEKNKLAGIAAGAQVNTVTGVKGSAENSYRTGNIEITKTNIGLGSVDNTSDIDKSVLEATQLKTARDISITDGTNTGIATSFKGTTNISIKLPTTIKATLDGAATSATKDSAGNIITDTYLTKTLASTTYLGISAKAASATTADSATKDSAGNTISTTYAPIASPALTGNPTVPTQNKNDSTTKIANTAYVDRAIADLIGGAPAALDTLKEISDIIGDTKDITGSLITEVSNKQPKHAALTSISGLTTAADKMIYTTGSNIYSTTDLTATGRSLISQTSTTAVRTLIGAIDSSATVAAATKDGSGNVITSTYVTKSTGITGLSINGKVITYTRGDGTTGTITTQDTVTTNTDSSVKQTNSTANTAYPILLKNGTGTSEITNSVLFNSGITINPSTGTITATTFSGTATKANQDGSGNVITSTYLTAATASSTYAAKTAAISSLTISGKTITWTKADGTTGTLTTQDTVTTNTDKAVEQVNKTDNVAYPILLKSGTGTTTTTGSAYFNSGITINPSTSTITATNFAGTATKANQDGSGNVITNTYVTKTTGITGLSISGKVITYTRGDGTTGTITTQDTVTTNTDESVKQTNSTANTAYPILLKNGTGTTTTTTSALFASGITVTPSTGTITATTFAGKATSAGSADSATKATKDGSDNIITSTYVKSVSLSGTTVTVTKGDNSTNTFTVATTNTDVNVQQTNSTANTAYPILLKNGTGTTSTTSTTLFNSAITVNPSTSTITATNFSGTATKATQDSSGNTITSTYATKSTTVTGVDISTGILSKTINGSTTYVPITIPYATCSTAAGTAAKAVTISNFTRTTGSRVTIKFTVTNTASNPSLNVNSTGAAAIYYRGYQIPAEAIQANTTLDLVFNGTQWDIVGSFFWVS